MRANRGKGWEAQLVTQHLAYRRDRRAMIFQAHPATKVVGGRIVREKAPPDFFGVADNPGGGGGIPVLFDAKEGRGILWGLSNLKDHQAKALEAWVVNGGRAGVVLRLPAGSWWIDWRFLGPTWKAWRSDGGRASLDPGWITAWAAPFQGADWLGAMLSC